MSQPESATPALHHLIGAYVNQDVFDFYSDVWAAVDDFVVEAPDDARAPPFEIATLLETHNDEDSVEAVLDDLGVGFIANPDEGGYRGWLLEVSRRAQAATSP